MTSANPGASGRFATEDAEDDEEMPFRLEAF